MFSLKNGTALAIVLSILFIVVAVGAREQLSSSGNGSSESTGSAPVELVGAEEFAATDANLQIGQSRGTGISTDVPTQEFAWEDEWDDGEADNDDYYDREDHDEDGEDEHGDEGDHDDD